MEKDVMEPSVYPPPSGPRMEPELLEVFEQQLTPDVARRLLELATRRTAMLRAAGVAVEHDEAKLLVLDAIAETLAQLAYWRHGEDPLSLHLRGVVKRRSWSRLARDGARAETAQESPAPGARALRVMQQVIARLDHECPEDAAVRLLLEAFCQGAAVRDEILARTHLSLEEYEAARRRLDRMLAMLPEPGAESYRALATLAAARDWGQP